MKPNKLPDDSPVQFTKEEEERARKLGQEISDLIVAKLEALSPVEKFMVAAPMAAFMAKYGLVAAHHYAENKFPKDKTGDMSYGVAMSVMTYSMSGTLNQATRSVHPLLGAKIGFGVGSESLGDDIGRPPSDKAN